MVRTLQAILLSCNFNLTSRSPTRSVVPTATRASTLFAEKDAAKHKEAAAADGYTLHTFFIDTFGKMDSKSLGFLKTLWAIPRDDPRQDREKPLPLSEVLAPLSEAIAKGNAQCVWKVHMLKVFRIDTSKAKCRVCEAVVCTPGLLANSGGCRWVW